MFYPQFYLAKTNFLVQLFSPDAQQLQNIIVVFGNSIAQQTHHYAKTQSI